MALFLYIALILGGLYCLVANPFAWAWLIGLAALGIGAVITLFFLLIVAAAANAPAKRRVR